MQDLETQEKLQPDFLPNLGCSLANLGKRVEAIVERDRGDERYLLFSNKLFFVDDASRSGRRVNKSPASPAEVTRRFYSEVENLKRLHALANSSPGAIGNPTVERILKNSAIVEIILSRDIDLGASENPLSKPKFAIGAAINAACEASGWTGQVTVDLSSPEKLASQVDQRQNIDVLVRVLKGFQTNNKWPIVIVDGYGKYAAETIGFPPPEFPAYGEDVPTTIVRASQAQTDYFAGYGSPIYSLDFHPYGNSDEVSKVNPPFDPERFRKLVLGLDHAVQLIEKGENVVLQAANRFGKTTILREFARLQANDKRVGIGIYGILDDGMLLDFSNRKGVNSINEILDQKVTTAIVDEAGRENIPESLAKEILEGLENSGVKVLRTYPGNVTSPEGYEVILVAQ